MHPRTRSILSVSAGALAIAACSEPNQPVAPRAPTAAAEQRAGPRTDGFIVILKPGSASYSRMRPGARLANVIPLDRTTSSDDAVISDAVPSIRGVVVRGVASASDISGSDVEEVIPNYVADIIQPVPTDESFVQQPEIAGEPTGTNQAGAFFFANNTQWGYKKISANRAWVPSRGGLGTKVCIIDSGIDPGHSSFVGKSITSISLLPNSTAQTDSNGHGSHVAGTVSTNGVGAASVAPDAALMTVKIFNTTGGGGSAANIINGVFWCADNGADVINMSLGFTGGIPTTPANAAFIAAFQSGLDYATNLGVLIVAAAGNDARQLPFAGRIFLPAEANGVTSVAALAPSVNLTPFGLNAIWSAPGSAFDGIASYSNRGPVPSVDISAPGGDLFSGWPVQSLIISVCSRQTNFGTVAAPSFPCAAGNSFLYEGGTSQASPHVAGVAALIRARWPSVARSPALRTKIESCLYRSVDAIGSANTFGRGRVNAFKATTQPC